MKKGNLVLAAICAVTGIGIIAVASGYPTAADYGTGVPGPGLWPTVISVVLLACTAILLYRTLKMPPEKNSKIELWTTGTRRVYLAMGILVVYLLVLPSWASSSPPFCWSSSSFSGSPKRTPSSPRLSPPPLPWWYTAPSVSC